MAGKTYVVFVGRLPGVYDNWADAEAQVIGFSGNKHCSYKRRDEAEKAFVEYWGLGNINNNRDSNVHANASMYYRGHGMNKAAEACHGRPVAPVLIYFLAGLLLGVFSALVFWFFV